METYQLSPPPSLVRRETEEYDRRQALLRRGLSFGSSVAGSSSGGASSSRTPLTLVKRKPEELPPVRAVKMELEAEPERRGGGVVGPEDFLPPAEADAMEAAILARSAREEEEVAERRRREEEINGVLFEQGLARAREFEEKEEAWRREAEAQDAKYVDLTSDTDDE